MKKGNAFDTIDPVVVEAAKWLANLQDAPQDAQLRADFESWRDANARHATAYARLEQLWSASDTLPSLAPPAKADRRKFLGTSMRAGAAAIVVLGTGRLLLGPHPFADYSTRAGERRDIVLADGSRTMLSTATALSVDYSAGERRIRLLAGEAWFGVAPDPARPFLVEAANGTTRALGTGFAVSLQGENVRVSVTEHVVEIRAGERATELPEGRQLHYGPEGLGSPGNADPTTLAWRDGRLAFINRPISEIAATLDQWTGSTTIITDPAVAARPATLMIATVDAATGIDRLANVVPMRVTRLGSLLTLIHST